MERYRIELARPEHLAQLAALERAAAQVFPPEVVPAAVRAESVPLDVLRAAQSADRLWVALHADAPVGFALLEIVDGEVLLAEIDVHPQHARQGLGRRLVAAVVDWARAGQLPSVGLTTFRDIPWNAPFYASLGFRTLAADELSPALASALAAEAARGLRHRVAMRLDLAGASD
jgi:GNAT superfamily N-acetyltransferase